MSISRNDYFSTLKYFGIFQIFESIDHSADVEVRNPANFNLT